MRLLWQGGYQTHRGDFYEVEQARLYTLPEEPPPIAVAAAKEEAAKLAGRAGDAFVNTAPDEEIIDLFEAAGGRGKPKYGQITMCWAESEEQARKTVLEIWPNAALGGDLSYELPLPRHFEEGSENVTEDDIAEAIPCGPDVDRYVEDFRSYKQAGYTHVYFRQIGRNQEPFFRFFEQELKPKLQSGV
jgi:coenzyme F420-dependent glucose-6-phosphate dehydrogenase